MKTGRMTLQMALRQNLNYNCNRKGYCDSYTHNIYNGVMEERFQEMFDNGSGGELHSKAEAVHSSSMLSYNMLHWISADHPFELEGIKYTMVFFEVQMRTLSGRSNPANMDVVLVGESEGKNHYLFIESKFTEYLECGKFELSDSYQKQDNWFNKSIEWESIIMDAKAICNNKCYAGGIKQGITHLFGIEGLKAGPALKWFNKTNPELAFNDEDRPVIKFANFIFEPSKKLFASEHDSYTAYETTYGKFIENLSGKGCVVPQWYSYSEIWEDMKAQIPDDELVNYLKNRYMQYAEPFEKQ